MNMYRIALLCTLTSVCHAAMQLTYQKNMDDPLDAGAKITEYREITPDQAVLARAAYTAITRHNNPAGLDLADPLVWKDKDLASKGASTFCVVQQRAQDRTVQEAMEYGTYWGLAALAAAYLRPSGEEFWWGLPVEFGRRSLWAYKNMLVYHWWNPSRQCDLIRTAFKEELGKQGFSTRATSEGVTINKTAVAHVVPPFVHAGDLWALSAAQEPPQGKLYHVPGRLDDCGTAEHNLQKISALQHALLKPLATVLKDYRLLIKERGYTADQLTIEVMVEMSRTLRWNARKPWVRAAAGWLTIGALASSVGMEDAARLCYLPFLANTGAFVGASLGLPFVLNSRAVIERYVQTIPEVCPEDIHLTLALMPGSEHIAHKPATLTDTGLRDLTAVLPAFLREKTQFTLDPKVTQINVCFSDDQESVFTSGPMWRKLPVVGWARVIA